MRSLIRLCCAVVALTLGAALYTNTVFSPAAYAALAAATPTPTPTPAVITVNSLSDTAANDGLCTLREAITSANTNTSSGAASGECAAGGALDTINFSVTGVILLTSALPDMTTTMSLNGPGARLLTISGNDTNRVFVVADTATVYLSGLTISGGKANGAAGIANSGTLTIEECAIADNHSTGSAGGLSNCGTLTIGNSTISNNTAADQAGGIMNGSCGGGSAVLTNTTVSSNSAAIGGGIVNVSGFTLRYSTVTANSATNTGGGIYNPGIGILNFGNTIIADNSAASSGPDGAGAQFNSEDYNLIGNTGGFSISGATTHNIAGVSADLGPLADNGGPTQTHRPHYTSPAVDKGRSVGGGFGVTTDQRGMARPLNFTELADAAGGDGSDIGAVELQGDDQPDSGRQPFVVNSTADTNDGSCDPAGTGTGNHDCTLREALNAANALPGADTITFDPTVFAAPGPHTIELTAALPVISTSVTVNGPGAGVLTLRRSTAGFYRLLYITAVPVRLSGMTLTNGRAPDGTDAAGGALVNFGVTTLTDVRITGNRSGDGTAGVPSGGIGGGIYNYSTLTMVNCLVWGNTSGNGVLTCGQNGDGGAGGGIYSSGVLTLTNCLVNGNSTGTGLNAGGNGGGVYASNETTLTNTTISNNTTGAGGFASSRGGGVYANGAILTLTNCTITGNSSQFSVDHGVAVGPSQASISIGNTIVARNGSGTQSDLTAFSNWYKSRGHNLIGVASDGGGGLIDGQNGDRVGSSASPVNPLLAPLGDYGGPTQTFALLPGSPAIDAGSSAGAPATDQRGVTRAGAADIGAFESRGFQLAATAGTPQSAPIKTTFGSPLIATMSSAFGEPTTGGLVTFSAPAAGAGGTFSGSTTVSINSSGVATAPPFTANGIAGGYNVVASTAGSLPATFALTNLKGNQTISFGSLADRTFGDAPFNVSATGGASTNPVTFSSLTPATCSVSGGTLTLLGAGACTIRASQAADSNYNSAPDVDRSFQIAKADSATTVSSSANPSGAGQSVTFNASVTSAAGTPTGSIQFKADGADLGAAPLNNGVATFETSGLAVGAHTITAAYGGDANFNSSSGALSASQVVNTVFYFSQSLYSVAEGGGSINITVKRTGDTSGAASVDYATDDASTPSVAVPCSTVTGLASERCDYTRAAGTLNFAAGESLQSFTVLINDDSYAEGAETLSLKLSNPAGGAVLGSQSTATLQITDDSPESSSNPVDDASFFVRQHYHDFLNREPDASGLQFWSGGITTCGADTNCRDVKRVDTSAAFFLSIEFQETGYLVERIYKTAYGDATSPNVQGVVPVVRLGEFLADTQRIGRGVVVGQGEWPQQLEANKQAFALEFVARQRFTSAYPSSLSAEAFVNQLNTNAGGVLTDSDKAQLEALFGGPASSSNDAARRALVLRQVAENQALRKSEFNRAFVLMQFFGYLRRNPDDAPDGDFRGWKFWLDKLNQFDGDFARAEMVKAFINADEYRNRFGR